MSEYNLTNRQDIPKDHDCCWNCYWMNWMVGIGQGVRCANKKNKHRLFREKWNKPDLIGDTTQPKLPVIPGVGKSCENFVNKYERAKNRNKYMELYAHSMQCSLMEAEEDHLDDELAEERYFKDVCKEMNIKVRHGKYTLLKDDK